MRARSKELAELRYELAKRIGWYDESANERIAAEVAATRASAAYLAHPHADREGYAAAREAYSAADRRLSQAQANQIERGKNLRRAIGLYLAAEHDREQSRDLWRELRDAAPGLAADRNELDDRRSQGPWSTR